MLSGHLSEVFSKWVEGVHPTAVKEARWYLKLSFLVIAYWIRWLWKMDQNNCLWSDIWKLFNYDKEEDWRPSPRERVSTTHADVTSYQIGVGKREWTTLWVFSTVIQRILYCLSVCLEVLRSAAQRSISSSRAYARVRLPARMQSTLHILLVRLETHAHTLLSRKLISHLNPYVFRPSV